MAFGDYQELVIIKHCPIFMYPRICNPYYLIKYSEFQSILNFLSCFCSVHILATENNPINQEEFLLQLTECTQYV